MTVKDQLKILDRKIKQNRADYVLYRTAPEVSALSSGDLDKYEYLTKKDLGYEPDAVQKARFEYFPLGQVFNKGLKADEKSEGLLKRLQNIEDKTDNQLRAIEDKSKDSILKPTFDKFKEQLSSDGNHICNEIIEEKKSFNNYIRSSFTRDNKTDYDFSHFTNIGDLFNKMYYGDTLIPEVEREQENLELEFEKLKKYKLRESGVYYQLKEDLLKNTQHLKKGREMVVKAFKDKIFPLSDPKFYPQYAEESSESEESNDTEELLRTEESNNSEESSGSTSNEEPSGSGKNNNSDRPPTMQEKVIPNIDTTKQKTNSSNPCQSLVYKYFLENSLSEISKKINKYEKDPVDLQIYNGLINLLSIGLKKIENGIIKFTKRQGK